MPSTIRQLRVFLCHASQDKSIVRELQQRLADEGWIDPWLDEKKLHPGEDWRVSIEEAVESSDSVVICLSNNSVDKEGFVQKELRYAREIALEKTEGTIFLIPLRLEDCDVPRGLRFFQWADYFGEKKEQSYTELLDSFSIRRQQIVRREQERALREAEEKEKREKEEKVRREAEELAKRETEELARRKALEIAIKEEEERTRFLALEKAKKEVFEKTLEDARERARLEAEVYAQKEIKEKKLKGSWATFILPAFLSIVSLLLVGLVFGIGLVGLGQMGMGPFAKEASPTAILFTPTSLPLSPTIISPPLTQTPRPSFTPTKLPTSTQIPEVVNDKNFTITNVSYDVERKGSCESGYYFVTAHITSNGTGKATYHWTRSDGAIDTNIYAPLVFTKASTQVITEEWHTSVSGLWLALYIDTPNNQRFGHANLNCP